MTTDSNSSNITNTTKPSNSNSNSTSNTAMNALAAASAKNSFVVNDASQDIPIFLRKTYHMVDTCNTEVCSWSEDGETFIVKHPKKFEQDIIPQFFKHSKFSSFVRQLNFYAFRKIKTNDSIRIDAALEAATANYWRFYHPKFQKGKPEWLQEIKRSSSTPRGSGTKKASAGAAPAVRVHSHLAKPDAVESSVVVGKENIELKTEVTSLKERIEAMTKNIDVLTTLVQNVSIAQKKKTEADENASVVNENNKRTKAMTPVLKNKGCVPDAISSIGAVPDSAPSNLCVPSFCETVADAPVSTIQPKITPKVGSLARESSTTTELSDQGFVDTLFTAFKEDEFNEDSDDTMGDFIDMSAGPDADTHRMDLDFSPFLNSSPITFPSPITSSTKRIEDANKNRPQADLMNRLSDALSLLPREIQELIVDRLIQAITSPKEIQESLQVTEALREVVATTTAAPSDIPMSVPQSPRRMAASCDDSTVMTDDDRSTSAASVVPDMTAVSPSLKPVPNPSLPLAAATLAALLSQYGKEPQCTAAVVAATNTLIPVHV